MMEDLIGEGFQIGNGDPAEPYIALLRGVDPADHDHQVKMAASRAYDHGWCDSKAHYASELEERVRVAREQTATQIHEDYADSHRRAFWQDCLVAAIAVVVVGCLLYLSKGN